MDLWLNSERVVQWLAESLAQAAGWHSSIHAKLVFHSSEERKKKKFSSCFLKRCCYYAGAGGELLQRKWAKRPPVQMNTILEHKDRLLHDVLLQQDLI